jgi:hypothetical protein
MKLPLNLLLASLLFAPLGHCVDVERGEDEDDGDQPKTVVVPNNPQARYEARLEGLKAAVSAQRERCRLSETGVTPFCNRDLSLYENKARRVIEQQLKDELEEGAAR